MHRDAGLDHLQTYEHMLWEFEIAYPYSTLGRTSICERRSLEFCVEDFARKVGTPEARILHGVGVLRKNGREAPSLLTLFCTQHRRR